MVTDVLPFDKREGSLWFDGKMVPWADAKIHVLTHGLHYASSVFEGERMYSGRIYKLEEHTARLFKSAEILDMTIPFSQKEINDASTDDEWHQIGERFGIRVVTESADGDWRIPG